MKQGCQFDFLKLYCEIMDFFNALGFYENQKSHAKSGFFQSEKLDFGKTLSELHRPIRSKSLLTRVYQHAGCKEYCKSFAVALKMFDVFNKKQMCDHVTTGKENNYFVFGYACSLCICL